MKKNQYNQKPILKESPPRSNPMNMKKSSSVTTITMGGDKVEVINVGVVKDLIKKVETLEHERKKMIDIGNMQNRAIATLTNDVKKLKSDLAKLKIEVLKNEFGRGQQF